MVDEDSPPRNLPVARRRPSAHYRIDSRDGAGHRNSSPAAARSATKVLSADRCPPPAHAEAADLPREIGLGARESALAGVQLRWKDDAALTVVMASKGYPGAYEKGHVIHGLAEAASLPGVTIFQAGTERRGADLVAVGGRVLDVTATGKDVAEARARAYAAIAKIHWQGAFSRSDIGWRTLNR